jgi:hypothetical protein
VFGRICHRGSAAPRVQLLQPQTRLQRTYRAFDGGGDVVATGVVLQQLQLRKREDGERGE